MIAVMVRRLTQAGRREQTRKRLLESARAVFGRRGFAGASLDEIAENAGLTRGALYYNFPGGKDDLFLALLDERHAARAEALEKALGEAGAGDIQQTIRQARAAAHDAALSMRANREWRLLVFEFALHAARERRFARSFGHRETKLRKALIRVIEERAKARGVDLPLPAEELALGINALGNGLALEDLIAEGSVPESLFEELVGYLLLGLATAAGTAAPAPGERSAA
jgi:AcrR family transcriptional regulator